MSVPLATPLNRRLLRAAATGIAVLGGLVLHLRVAHAQCDPVCDDYSEDGECEHYGGCDGDNVQPDNEPEPEPDTSDSDSFWHDIYHHDCSSPKDRGLLVDSCDYDDQYAGLTPSLIFGPVWGPTLPPFPTPPPSTVLTSAPWVPGSGSNLASQVSPAGPGVGRAPTYEQIGMAMNGRVDDFQFGFGGVGLIAHGASGFLLQGTFDFEKRFAWLNPYGGLALGGGMVSYNKEVPGTPGDGDCETTEDGDLYCPSQSIDAGIFYLAARAGVRVFLSPYVAVGVEGQRSLLSTQKLESLGLTMDFDIPLDSDD
jgi:hypothetical protein